MTAPPRHNLPPLQDITFDYDSWIPELYAEITAQDHGIVVLSAPEGSGKITIALATVYQLGADTTSMRDAMRDRGDWDPLALSAPYYGTIIWARGHRPLAHEGLSARDREKQARRQLYQALSAVLEIQIGSPTHFTLALEELSLQESDARALIVLDQFLDALPVPAPTTPKQPRPHPRATIWEHVATLARKHRVLIISHDENAMRKRIDPLGVSATYVSLPPFDEDALNRFLHHCADEESDSLDLETLETIEATARRLHTSGQLNLYLLRELYGHAHSGLPMDAAEMASVASPDASSDASRDPVVERAVSLMKTRLQRLGNTDYSRSHLLLLAFTFFDRDLGPTAEMLEQVLPPHMLGNQPRQTVDALLASLCRQRLIVRTRTFSRENGPPPVRYALLPATYEEVPKLAKRVTRALKDNLHDRIWDWCLNFTADHGGLDCDHWVDGYGRLREEWPNLLGVLEHCHAGEHFDHVRKLWDWKHLQQFANIFGYWPERLKWLGWIIRRARAGKLPFPNDIQETLGEACAAQAFTLVHYNTLKRAELILDDVATLASTSPYARCEAEGSLALLRIRQGRDDATMFAMADAHLQNLERYTNELGDVASLQQELQQLEDDARHADVSMAEVVALRQTIGKKRAEIDHRKRMKRRWEIEVSYYRGIAAYEQRQWGVARHHFEVMRETGRALESECGCRYVRADLYAVSYLADIALRECEGKPEGERQALLDQARGYLAVIEKRMSVPGHFDTRRRSYILRTLALEAFERLDYRSATRFTRQARWRFAVLGMRREHEEMERLLARIPQG